MSSALESGALRQGGRAAAATPAPLDPRHDFAAVYEAHYQAVYRVVRGVVLDPGVAEDVTQDAFLAAYRARGRYRPAGPVEAWLCTIAVRAAIGRLRSTAGRRRQAGGAGASRPCAGGPALLDGLLSTLAPEARAVVVLHLLQGRRHREIAAMLRLPEATVASHLSQALTVMREASAGAGPMKRPASRVDWMGT